MKLFNSRSSSSIHLSDGRLRAFADGQVSGKQSEQIEAHLSDCPRCQERASLLAARTTGISWALESLAPPDKEFPSARIARAHLQSFISRKETIPMSKKIFSRAARPAWVVLTVIALLAISMAFQPVRAIAVNFLGLFRVQQVAVVPFNPANLPANVNGTQISDFLKQNFKFEQTGEIQEASDAAQAGKLAGFSVRLPSQAGSPSRLTVQPGGKASFKVDLAQVRALLQEMGRQDIQLPDELNGATITAVLPASVTSAFGSCKYDAETARKTGQDPDMPRSFRNPDCQVLVQLPSPTVQTPPGLDINALGKEFLMMTGMTAQDADSFSQTIDWTTTLVIPVPTNASSQKVQVDGVQGVFIQEPDNNHYMLMWVKDGIVYALDGQGGQADALAIADSLK
jgi:anti-sigma factor RsiW